MLITLHLLVKNVFLSVWHTDMSHTLRLSSVWPNNLQYHSLAAAAGFSCAGYVKMAADFTVAQQFKHLKKQKIVFYSSLANNVSVSVS